MFLPVLAPKVVCIDPGHPSEVGVGTQGKTLTELQANWTIAVRLRDLLTKDGYRVVMTKSSERQHVRNRRRAEVANEVKADLMVRLHCDASPRAGFAVYYPDRQGTAEGRTGPSSEVIRRTRPLALRFHAALAQGLKGELVDQGLMSDTKTAVGGKQGALTGSIFSEVPVVLVEMATITLRHDEAFMLSESGQVRMAAALEAGVVAALDGERGSRVVNRGWMTIQDPRSEIPSSHFPRSILSPWPLTTRFASGGSRRSTIDLRTFAAGPPISTWANVSRPR